MDIIVSFLKNDNKYSFTKFPADASKKQFYKIEPNKINMGEYNNLILTKITTEPGLFDEFFDENITTLSQYDYFKHTLQIFDKLIGSVPKIIAYDDKNGIIIMENVGTIRLKEQINANNRDKYTYAAIDWLVKLQQIKLDNCDIINLRNYGKEAMKKEILLFVKYGLSYINDNDYGIFDQEIENILKILNSTTKTINHRDYQPRNIMLHFEFGNISLLQIEFGNISLLQSNNLNSDWNASIRNNLNSDRNASVRNDGSDTVKKPLEDNKKIYIIDTQDTCIGPYYADFTTLILNINSNPTEWKIYAKYFYDKISKNIMDTFENFYQKFLLYGFIRILKSTGSHLKYFKNNNRLLSLDQIQTNKNILQRGQF